MGAIKVILICLFLIQNLSWAIEWKDRFVWIFGFNIREKQDVEKVISLVNVASKINYNGIVLSGGLDSLCKQDEKFFEGLEKIKRTCEQLQLELVPAVFSVGYGSPLSHDRNLAEGLPVKDSRFVVTGNRAVHFPERKIEILNGGFESYQGNRLTGYRFHDEPGKISFVDTQIKHSGSASLRFEKFGVSSYGNARIMQEIDVIPYRCYKVTIWVKTENLKPSANFRILVLGENKDIAPRSFNIPSTTDWRKLTMLFNSLEFSRIKLYVGIWGGKEGKFWIDDWKIEEVALYNVLRRPGTPVVVKSEDGTIVYEEGKDYEKIFDPYFNPFRRDFDYPQPVIRIPSGSRIKDGEYLRVSWYHPMLIYDSQVSVCMAEPALYEIFDHEAKLLWEKLKYKKVILNMDEIRMGGTCQGCEGRDMAKLLGSCVTRQFEILKKYNPEAEIYIWSDMFDPNHNAKADYYLVKGDFRHSWNYIPRDLIIGVWGGKPREKSLKFFAEKGFKILIANYYDADNLEDVKEWLNLAKNVDGVCGFMYTTWQKKYEMLGEYSNIVFSKDKN
ncbi:MAG: hypothetical protein NC913_06250 [Candidatus Omnitrophica bacterium]|nr:hypothetical protein [Candidatus Omnitrophota bacterium]